jgi:RNA polymerase sigma-70 factor, ECF subfamily
MRTTAAMTEPLPFPQAAERARDEEALLAALADGENRAAAELLERTHERVWAALFKLSGGDRELAADLTQETFRRAWAALATFDHRARFSTWVFRIAYNAFLNHARRPHVVVPLEEEHAAASRDPDPGQEQMVIERERVERLRRAVLDLPDALRLTVTARYWGELPATEIARLEGISEEAVRKRLRKALGVLGNALEVLS